jgi:uncharacterized protein with PIN domain
VLQGARCRGLCAGNGVTPPGGGAAEELRGLRRPISTKSDAIREAVMDALMRARAKGRPSKGTHRCHGCGQPLGAVNFIDVHDAVRELPERRTRFVARDHCARNSDSSSTLASLPR